MDFRCDQSHGLHFIYLLPTSPTEALVESTLFSADLLQDDHYIRNINIYLNEVLQITDFEVTDTEKCDPPQIAEIEQPHSMHRCARRGVTTGQAMPLASFRTSLSDCRTSTKDSQWRASSPLSFFDLWMDKVFICKTAPWSLCLHICLSAKRSLALNLRNYVWHGALLLFENDAIYAKMPFIIAALIPRTMAGHHDWLSLIDIIGFAAFVDCFTARLMGLSIYNCHNINGRFYSFFISCSHCFGCGWHMVSFAFVKPVVIFGVVCHFGTGDAPALKGGQRVASIISHGGLGPYIWFLIHQDEAFTFFANIPR